ncbi:hypothetical protein ACVDG5_019060 [Mesorhizobium sp. ORM6]
MLKLVQAKKVLAFATDYPVMTGRISVDLAVRALEKQPHEKVLQPIPGIVSTESVATFDLTRIFAPEGWRPEFSVK